MAFATDSTPSPARRLLRAASPCRILTSADILALVGGKDLVAVERAEPCLAELSGATRHTRVFREHDVGGLPRAPQGLVTDVDLGRHGPFSRSVLPTSVRLRS